MQTNGSGQAIASETSESRQVVKAVDPAEASLDVIKQVTAQRQIQLGKNLLNSLAFLNTANNKEMLANESKEGQDAKAVAAHPQKIIKQTQSHTMTKDQFSYMFN
jgi:hypothetical protein